MKRKFWSLTCGVALASLLGSVSPASAADPKGFKPTISANPAVVSLEATAKAGKTTLSYNAGTKHPFVEVWVSVNGAHLKKVLEDNGDGKGSHTVTVEQGKKYRYVLTDFGKELAFVEVTTRIVGLGTIPETTPVPKPDDMAKAIVNFANSKVGQKGLGDGQCTRLIEAALSAAGAKPGKGFVWGRTLKAGETMRPGDIIQFTSFVIKDGFAVSNLGIPNHTAIVSQVSGNKVTLLHQNVDGEPATEKSRVHIREYDFAKKVSGSFIVYRPEPK